jgi:hypothetical protein
MVKIDYCIDVSDNPDKRNCPGHTAMKEPAMALPYLYPALEVT